jgi:pimeloyl-ACP methyl ester carboxylesterase
MDVSSAPRPRRRRAGRTTAALLGALLLSYTGILGYLVVRETTIVFEAPAELGDRRPADPFEPIEIPRANGSRQLLWVMPRPAAEADRPWLLFLHGNGSTVATRLNILHCEQLRQLGLNVVAPEYSGFGGRPGTPSELALREDASAAYQYLRTTTGVSPDRIIIFGWSLGSAVAVDLASRVPEAAVILEGAPASLVDIGQRRYPFVPIRLLMRNPFESIRKIDNISAPVLFLHSPEDVVIPIDEGRKLFDAVRGPKQFVEISGGHVYAVERDPRFFPAIRTFLAAHHLL